MNELLEFLLFHSDSDGKLHFYNLIGLSKYKDWLDREKDIRSHLEMEITN